MTEIDDKLLEQQEEEQKESEREERELDYDNIGTQFEVGGNEVSEIPMADEELKQYQEPKGEREKEKNKEKVTTIDPVLDLDPYIHDRDYAEYIIQKRQ